MLSVLEVVTSVELLEEEELSVTIEVEPPASDVELLILLSDEKPPLSAEPIVEEVEVGVEKLLLEADESPLSVKEAEVEKGTVFVGITSLLVNDDETIESLEVLVEEDMTELVDGFKDEELVKGLEALLDELDRLDELLEVGLDELDMLEELLGGGLDELEKLLEKLLEKKLEVLEQLFVKHGSSFTVVIPPEQSE